MNPTKPPSHNIQKTETCQDPPQDILSRSHNIKYLTTNFTHNKNLIPHQAIGILMKLIPLLNRSSDLPLENKLLIKKKSCPSWKLTSNAYIKQLQKIKNTFIRWVLMRGELDKRKLNKLTKSYQ